MRDEGARSVDRARARALDPLLTRALLLTLCVAFVCCTFLIFCFFFLFFFQCYDYLFEIAVKMVQAGLDPAACPPDSEYRDQQRRGVKKQ